nr:hypothetical protein [Actinomycetota bacterium]
RLPGPVSDREHVSAGLGNDGSLESVSVVQRLTVRGLGDFSFKIPGPAQDVTALPASENPPGLRKGSVIWQGFCDGRKFLGATMPLFPDREKTRMPVVIAISATIDGRPISATNAQSGPFEMDLTVTNQSSQPVSIEAAKAKPPVVAAVLDRVRASLSRGDVPRPGQAGVPRDLRIERSGPASEEQIEAPFAIKGTLVFRNDEMSLTKVEGARSIEGSSTTSVRFHALLGGGHPLSTTVHLHGDARDFTRPALHMEGSPALPDPASLGPGSHETWVAAARAGAASGTSMVVKLFETMWRVARLRQFDAYLGNPDSTGRATSSYSFTFAPPPKDVVASGPAVKRGSLALTITGLIALVLLLFDALYLWALS